MSTVAELRRQSGTSCFVSFFGKSTVPETSPDYQLMRHIAGHVIERGAGVIHGGYTGGMMEAVSTGAQEAIERNNLPPERNIGVPHVGHDKTHGARTKKSAFCDVMNDTCDRLRAVASGDIAIVCAVGGDGTELEESYIFSENTYIEKPIPLIYIQTTTGTQWKEILEAKVRVLEHSQKQLSEFPWLYIAHSFEEAAEILDSLISTFL